MHSVLSLKNPVHHLAIIFILLMLPVTPLLADATQTVDERPQFQPCVLYQTDFQADIASDQTADGFEFRRFRPGLKASFPNNIQGKMVIDFAGEKTSLMDMYIDATLGSTVKVRLGKMKPPFATENLQSNGATLFLERAFTTYAAPSRDVGVQGLFSTPNGLIEWQVGLFNGAADGSTLESNDDEAYDLVSRLWMNPRLGDVAKLGLGGAVTYGKRSSNDNLTRFKSPAGRTLFSYATGQLADGELFRWHASFYSVVYNMSLLGEFTSSTTQMLIGTGHSGITTSAWQVATSFVLNGTPGFKGVVSKDISKHNTIELKARVHGFFVDDEAFISGAALPTQANRATAFGAGINWYPVHSIRLMLDIEKTMPSAYSGTIEDETTLMLSFQYAF